MTQHIGALDWVLVLAPYRKDAEYLQMLLAQHQVPVRRAADAKDLITGLAESPGVLVATHEALKPEILKIIAEHLAGQPNWSEMPIVILLDRAAHQARIRAELSVAWPRSRQLYYQRPVAALELLSGIQSALLARLRQRDVRDHIEREVELRHELNHRVKNILASVMSIFEMTRRSARTLDDLTEDFRGRLAALANVHSAVFQAGGEAVDITQIAEMTFMPYRIAGQDRIKTEGPAITLSREAGTTLALCLHELATNAIKYGALSQGQGQVRLRWALSRQSGALLRVEWAESGGPPVSEPSRTGYGTRYVRSALCSLFGAPPTISFHPEGFRMIVAGPLSRVSLKDGVEGLPGDGFTASSAAGVLPGG